MILNKKTCDVNEVDSLIEQLYLQTKHAYFKAQTPDIKEIMSPYDKCIQKTSLTSFNKQKSDSKLKTVNVFDQRDSSSNCEMSIAEKSSGSLNNKFSIRGTSSNFEKSVSNEISDFETIIRDVSVRSNSSSNYELSTTKTNYDSKLEKLTVEYSNIRRLSSNFDSAITLHRKLENQVMHSDIKMISTECQSKVVVQSMPQIEFGDKFDLLKSGVSNSTLGFKPCTFSPISSMSSLIHQESDPELSLSEEDCVQDTEAETNDKNITSNGEIVLMNSNAKKRKIIEENIPSPNDRDTSETNNTDTVIKKFFKGNEENSLTLENNEVKLCDIKYIAPKLEVASTAVVRTLHYILYGTYGLTRNHILMCQTIENILQFNGFPFSEETEIFKKKRNLLINLPIVLYVRIYDILLNHIPENKQTSLEKLICFLKEPSENLQESEITEEEKLLEKLKEKALQAQPVVKVQKLDEAIVNVMLQKNLEALETASRKFSNKKRSTLQQKKLSLQLKTIPGVAENILKARRRIINLLHSLLYGRPGSEEINRKNILEFSGFKSHQKNFLSRRLAFLYRLKMKEIEQLCDVVTVPAKSGNKNKKIKKLLNFFSFLEPHQKKSKTSTLRAVKPVVKLGDFEKIHANVECAAPTDLTALNDLLYVKPCDSSEMHQKILDFSSFPFDISSFDFQYRRTLMHYMDIKTVKKIAKILDIEDWENCTNLSELSLRVLKFLMDLKLPAKKKSRTEQKCKRERTHPHILKFCSRKTEKGYYKSRSCTPETFDSTYASEEVNEIESEEITPTSAYHQQRTPSSRVHYHHKDFPDKHTQILNDSTPLLDLMQHPTDKELLSQIDKIINNTSLSITVGQLVKQVLNSYSKFDLHYRIEFIRDKALEVLQELRLGANVFPE